jgi:glutamine---fructose-6-phosphate transaminase (isomerizing)
MCGIFGYVGSKTNAGSIVIRGLKNLEYRGYDSWGVALQRPDGIYIRKDIGKISGVKPEDFDDKPSSLAMAHAGRRTAASPKRMHTRTSPTMTPLRWCTTASSKTFRSCAKS